MVRKNEEVDYGRLLTVLEDYGRRGAGAGARDRGRIGDFKFVPATDRYELRGLIAAGGMGDVHVAYDHDLRRRIAMKLLKIPRSSDAAGIRRLKFIAEAQATSQLEHPGIPPVHDIGVWEDGRYFFTMKLVRGQTLEQVLQGLHLGGEIRKQFGLHRLASVLERIADAVHFAHQRGVIHRDLKPANIMLGEYGEVHVMDWGIAKFERPGDNMEWGDWIETVQTASGIATTDGRLKGTIQYMSPEQAAGEKRLDCRSDVYALGCLLYEILTLQKAFPVGNDESMQAVMHRVRLNRFIPVRDLDLLRSVPDALIDLCERSMSVQRHRRPPDAHAFAQELRNWLDGSEERNRCRLEAEDLTEKGLAALRKLEHLKEAISDAAAEVARVRKDEYEPFSSVEEAATLEAARERVRHLRREAAVARADGLHLLNAALEADTSYKQARKYLVRVWAGALQEAELNGETDDAVVAERMLDRLTDGDHPLLRETGTLELRSDPPGAEVTLHPYVARNGILHEGASRALGETRISVTLPLGSYLCVLRRDGHADVRYPVDITRRRDWTGRVRLPRLEDIETGAVFIPAGWFVYGQGPGARVVELADFVIDRYPVTFRQYGEFLYALREAGDPSLEDRMSRSGPDGKLLTWDDDGKLVPLPDPGFWDWPVLGARWEDAAAYCEWRKGVTGRPWRLPTEEEWEKAARGVDGRRFPWGDLAHSSLAKCLSARPSASQPEPVGTFTRAVSPYGMGDAAGGVYEWTASWHDDAEFMRVLRGGTWCHDILKAQCAHRHRLEPSIRSQDIGFRCVYDLE